MIERRIKAAKFAAVKSLEALTSTAIPSLNGTLGSGTPVPAIISTAWENIIALGPSGTGKTHIALGLGLAACQRFEGPLHYRRRAGA